MRHSVTIKCLQYWHKAWLGSICTGNKSGLKQIYTLNLIMIAKYSEHIDTEVNADQKYKRHTELRCPVATSDKCTPHQICIQGLKYIRNILKSVFFSGADLLRKKIGEQQVNCSPSLKHPPVTLRCSLPFSLPRHSWTLQADWPESTPPPFHIRKVYARFRHTDGTLAKRESSWQCLFSYL